MSMPVLIASMKETSDFTAGGAICAFAVAIIASIAAVVVTFAPNAIQQATSCLIALTAILPFGIGAIIGRRRSYAVYREIHPSGRGAD